MYAVVETGSKQYKVAVGDIIEVEKLDCQPGNTVVLDRVLMISDEDQVRVGQPTLEGAQVTATALNHFLGRKALVFKYRPKERYRRKVGHRQPYTRLRIEAITE